MCVCVRVRVFINVRRPIHCCLTKLFLLFYTQLLCLFLCMWRSEDLQHSGRRKHILTFKSGFILDALHTCTVRPKVQGKALLKTSELKKLRYNLMRSVRLLCKIKFTLNMGNHIQNNMSCLVFLFVLLFCCRALFSQDKIHSLRKNILHTHTCWHHIGHIANNHSSFRQFCLFYSLCYSLLF